MRVDWARKYGKLLLLVGLPSFAGAWQLSPEGSFIERKLASRSQNYFEKVLSSISLRGIAIVGNSGHEEITNRTLGCVGDADICGAPEYEPEFAYILAGVRWNDDPPFRFSTGQGNFSGCKVAQTVRLTTQPVCWANTFKDGEARAAKGVALDGSNATMLVRSHFGDLQFLHAMAASDGESPEVTRARILAWAEFAWRSSRGEYDLETTMVSLPIAGFLTMFSSNREWRIQDLYALGNPHIRTPDAMAKVAFGNLLHIVQDSFAEGHVERRTPVLGHTCAALPGLAQPGKIVEFHSYSHQDSGRHGHSDSRNAFSAHWSADKPSVVDVGKELNAFRLRKSSWDEVKPYLECIFTLDPQARVASAGDGYSRVD